MENYEQKYKEALSWAHSAIKAGADGMLKEDLERVFPELRESEDERIRKGLIKGLSAMRDIHKHQTFSDDAINIDDAIAWLEKQGEQKPYPETLDKAIELYYYSYGNGKGGFDKLSLENFKDIIKTFVEDYGNKYSWSEEDEKFYISALWHIKNSCGNGGKDSGEYEVYNWLKSIKPNHWKPSEEQLRAIINSAQGLYQCKEKEVLLDLYEQLKNL